MTYGIISADDHVVETPEIWQDRLPAKYREAGPRIVRKRITYQPDLSLSFEFDDEGEWADVWLYEDVRLPNFLPSACAGVDKKDVVTVPVLYEDMRPGCFRVPDRISDMDLNGVEVSMCFPNMFVRFCGQRFLEAADKELALSCVRAYNDWIVEDWAGPSNRRLVPLCIVPLWDAELAAAEVRRNANRGVKAVSFSEIPANLGLPSIHSGYWEPFICACAETGTAINLHIGSGSRLTTTTNDAPTGVITMLSFVTPAMALSDWLLSGHLMRHPDLTIALAECNIGWIPYILERADTRWGEDRGYQPEWKLFDGPPSSYFAKQMYCSFFNDQAGLSYIHKVGVMNNFSFDNLTFETDYPHSDGTWPNSRAVADSLMLGISEKNKRKLMHDNAARLLGLSELSVTPAASTAEQDN
jgi:predicted TIM-barrel fold metal-dependent hydrolase